MPTGTFSRPGDAKIRTAFTVSKPVDTEVRTAGTVSRPADPKIRIACSVRDQQTLKFDQQALLLADQ